MTVKDWLVVEWSIESVAVTVIVDVSPCVACVVSRIRTPLGFVVDRVAEVILTGLIGSETSPVRYRSGFGHRPEFGSAAPGWSVPVTIWPKIV